jgi:hypothetical protein
MTSSRRTDPHQQVQQALARRQGQISQADIVETKRAVSRLGSVGDDPEATPGDFTAAGELWGGGGGMRFIRGATDQAWRVYVNGDGVEEMMLEVVHDFIDYSFGFYNVFTGTTMFHMSSQNTSDNPLIQVIGTEFRVRASGGSTVFSIDPTTGDVTGTGNIIQESAEQSTTPVAGATSNAAIANNRRYMFFTLPTTEKWYVITGIEWMNKATVAGNIWFGVDLVDANPPVSNESTLVAWGMRPQGGINAAQKATRVSSHPIRGGTTLGAWINPDDATATLGSTAVASANLRKVVTAGSPALIDNSAWVATTAQYYVKAYYRGIR